VNSKRRGVAVPDACMLEFRHKNSFLDFSSTSSASSAVSVALLPILMIQENQIA